MEHNHVAIIQILLCHAQITIDTIQCEHPAGKASIGKLTQCRAILRRNARDIVAGGIVNRILISQRLHDDIERGRVIPDRNLSAVNPFRQIAVHKRVLLALTAMGGIAQQREGNGNIIPSGLQHGDSKLYLGRAVGQRHGLFTTLVGVKAGDLNIFGIHNRISLVHRPMRCADHSTEVKGLSIVYVVL